MSKSKDQIKSKFHKPKAYKNVKKKIGVRHFEI